MLDLAMPLDPCARPRFGSPATRYDDDPRMQPIDLALRGGVVTVSQ
jgi:hypothetical protein